VSDNATRIWAGLDLGGTGTRAVIIDDVGRTLNGATMPTNSFGPDAVEQLANRLSGLIDDPQRLAGIGIGASGPVDLATGQIHNPDTLPQFTGLDVAAGLQRALTAPAWIDNDAVVAGLAETQWGQAGATESLLCVTLGTGIGAVLIEAGRPRRAADGQHPEAGHIPVAGTGHPCYCGLPQCWEQVASRTALDGLRRAGEHDATRLWVEYAERVASGLITLVTLYHPAGIVIGGSVSQHWAELAAPLLDSLSRFREYDPATTLVASTLGERAGALGAALLPKRGIGWHQGDLGVSLEKEPR
jgi:glucokinase